MKREIPLIALIDDDVALNAAFSASLTDAGYYTLPCVSRALAAQIVVEEVPELVIVALPMGVMHLIANMQQYLSTESIPLIVYADDWHVLRPHVVTLQAAGCVVLHQVTLMAHLLTIVEDVIGAPPLLARMV